MGKVFSFPPSTDYVPEQALHSALQFVEDDNLKDVLIIGMDADNELLVRSSKMDRKNALWLIELCKQHILYGE